MFVLSSTLSMTLWLVVVASPLEPDVRGETACPSASEVTARLTPLLSPEAGFPAGDFVELVDVPSQVAGLVDVELRLRRAGADAPLAVRRVERGAGCLETTDAVAVIAASWTGRLETPGPPAEPSVGARWTQVTARPMPAAARSDTRFFLGAMGALATATTGGMAPVVGVEVAAQRGRWGLRLAVLGMGERQLPVSPEPGRAVWRRLVAQPSLGATWGTGAVFVEANAGLLLGMTETRGQGFATNGSDVGVDAGVAPQVRLGVRPRSLPGALWVGATGLFWLRPHTVSVADGGGTSTMPFFDLCLGAGMTFRLGTDS